MLLSRSFPPTFSDRVSDSFARFERELPKPAWKGRKEGREGGFGFVDRGPTQRLSRLTSYPPFPPPTVNPFTFLSSSSSSSMPNSHLPGFPPFLSPCSPSFPPFLFDETIKLRVYQLIGRPSSSSLPHAPTPIVTVLFRTHSPRHPLLTFPSSILPLDC